MGFGKKVTEFIVHLPERWTVLVSATPHKESNNLDDISLKDPQ